MSNHWWRAYDEAVDDPKLQLLPDRLFRGWFNLCCLTSANGGALPPIAVIAFKLRISEAKVKGLIAELREAVLIDEDGAVLRPHNWTGRQYKTDVTDPTNADRQKRYRDRHGVTAKTVTQTVTTAVTGKRPDTDTDSSVPRGTGETPCDLKAELFKRGREVLGPKSGGSLTAKLLKSLGKEDDPKVLAKARSRIEDASTKANPAEWLGRIMAGPARAVTSDGQLYPEGIV